MSEKHSPGPWRWKPQAERDDDDVAELLDRDGHRVCDFGSCASYDQACGEEPNDADARLIAAGPEMYDFLLEDAAEHVNSCGRQTECRHKHRLALLARIDGKDG